MALFMKSSFIHSLRYYLPLLTTLVLLTYMNPNFYSDAFQLNKSSLRQSSQPFGIMNRQLKQRERRFITAPMFLETDDAENQSEENKFTFAQRIESTKTGIVGLLSGGIALTPFSALHNIVFPGSTIENGTAQWEFDTDMGSIETALFAIVYRYCVREGEEANEMLGMGVVGAFVLVRSLSKIRVPSYCTSAPLDCGDPLGYFDWAMIQQGVFSGIESAAMFVAAATAMDYCYRKGYISRFN
eukprot:CAMPEP_0184864332 /NCGR_PEP_ID=MMETSP0580-20130426/14543_1 /TAXON_ID=1118495 /ORGANISM="Dactyliosolen fragilissimus" /LENGTH=241 /DNA_ID=CAMNT_0027363061 /DNA_START=55 /DNA_END=780 /DNA_ORIENTATION=+